MASSMRDQPGTMLRFYNAANKSADMPSETVKREFKGGFASRELAGKESAELKEEFKKQRAKTSESHEVKVLDARNHLPGGLDAWKLDTHGFCFVAPPAPVKDFKDKAQVLTEYAPRLEEIVQTATGAKRCFFLSHLLRTVETGRGTTAQSYARVAHSDYGPEFEPLFRQMLVGRFGLPEEEARTCGLAVVNLWAPFGNPAYQDPLCLLDCTSISMETDTTSFRAGGDLQFGSKRPVAERVPAAAQDAPALAPRHSPNHRWVFCPDMRTDEAVIFKQYDWRPNVAACTFHVSFHDRFNDAWKDCPGRNSIENRFCLVFDASSAKSGGKAISKSKL